jgi:hypothetical protein
LIQRLNSQAEADEQEAQKILEDTTAEEKTLQAEIDQAQIEYDKSLAEMVAAENYVALTEDQARNEIFREAGDTSSIYGNYLANQRGAAAQLEADYAMNIEAYNIRQQIVEQETKLKKAQEYFALGLIPPSATDEQRILFVDAIDNAEKEKWEGMKFRKATIDLARIHQALVRAHNAFQLKNKDAILKARYGKKVNNWTIREVGKQYLPFGSPTNKNPRYGKIMRTYYNVGDHPEKPSDGMYYIYNDDTGEWEEEYPLLGFMSAPGGEGPQVAMGVGPIVTPQNTPQLEGESEREYKERYNQKMAEAQADLENKEARKRRIFFTRDGVFPNVPWLRTRWEPYQRYHTKMGEDEFVAYFKDENQKIGRYNQKRGYSKCKPGYWFYETIPEEASQCVYMGHSMVDTNFSYYPASIGFSYEKNIHTDDIDFYKEKYGEDGQKEYEKAIQLQSILTNPGTTTVDEAKTTVVGSINQQLIGDAREDLKDSEGYNSFQGQLLQQDINHLLITNNITNVAYKL